MYRAARTTVTRILAPAADLTLGLLGLFESPNGLVARLDYLARRPFARPRLRLAVAVTAMTALTLLVLPMAPSVGALAADESPVRSAFARPVARDARGVVLDAGGKPVPGAKVTLYPYHKYDGFPPVTVTTGEDGRFAAQMPVGPDDGYNICLAVAKRAADVAMSMARWRIGAPSFDEVRMTLLPAGKVSASLVDDNGRPLSNARAVVWSIRPDASSQKASLYLPSFPQFQKLLFAGTGLRGEFAFDGLPRGCVAVVSLGAEGRATFLERFAADDAPRTVVMPREATLTGRVVARGGRHPLHGLTVLLCTLDCESPDRVSDTVSVQTTANGRFSMSALPAAEAIVAVAHDSLPPPWTCVPHAPLKLEPGKTADVTIELVEGAPVRGRVLDKATGKPLPRGWVMARPGAPGDVSIPSDYERTDENGSYTLYLAPGSHTLLAAAEMTSNGPIPLSQERAITVLESAVLDNIDFAIDLVPQTN